MSLYIDPELVVSVLLGAEWIDIDRGSFDLDAYEVVEVHEDRDEGLILHGGGQSGICATGFRFTVRGMKYVGPFSSLLALRMGER